MKTYKILISLTLILVSFSWCYNNFLREETYVKFLPNYKKQVSFPIYPIESSKRTKTLHFNATNDLLSYVPLYGKTLYWFDLISFMCFPFLFLITIVLGIRLYIRNDELKVKWLLFQVLIFIIILTFIFSTNQH